MCKENFRHLNTVTSDFSFPIRYQEVDRWAETCNDYLERVSSVELDIEEKFQKTDGH